MFRDYNIACFLPAAVLLLAPGVFVTITNAQNNNLDEFAFCGDCWCIPDNDDQTCPSDDIPRTEWSDEFIRHLNEIPLENPISLSCDPYTDEQCDTEPPLESGAVCAAEITTSSAGASCSESSYRLVTMSSREEAENNGFYVTHEGPCGLCSAFQDLSIYMTLPDLADKGINCAFRALVDVNDGVECYKEIGFSDGCSAIWLYNTLFSGSACITPCLQHASSGLPNNNPAPGCELVECIQCDEDAAGDIFKQFSGRTRRSSGLLSQIVRPCSSVPEVIHVDPCSLSAPTAAPGSGGSRREVNAVVSQVLLGSLILLRFGRSTLAW